MGSVAAASAIAVGASLNAGAASAALIGQYDFAGSLFFSVNAFDFITEPGDGGDGSPSPGIAGSYTTGFSDFGPSGSFGSIEDLCRPPFACPVVPSQTEPLADFLVFDDGSFDLETVSGPDISTSGSFTTVQFDVTGTFIDGSDLSTSAGSGRFTSQIPNSSFQGPDLIAFLAGEGPGFFVGPQTYSATFTAVPEPATTAGLIAAGAMGFAARMRNKKKQAAEADSSEA
ncbi:MAG: PEP-CTERM sorting domain-containing protein [Cyanobacteria bacterium J06639_1]